MTKTVTLYEIETGRIGFKVTVDSTDLVDLEEGQSWIEGEYFSSISYIEDGEVKYRPELDLPDQIVVNLSDNEVELPDIPEDTVVHYDGMEAGVADEEGITLSFDEAGKWEIYFDPPFPYQPAIIEAEVEDD